MYKSVVVPLDGSKLAEVAIPPALSLVKKLATKIVLLSVVEPPTAHYEEGMRRYAVKTVAAIRQHYDRAGQTPVNIESTVLVGEPAKVIVEYSSEGSSKLLVMATNGRSGVGRWVIGSVADKVLRATTRQPMVLIRAKGSQSRVRAAAKERRKILIPLDGSLRSEAIIPYVSEIAEKYTCEITLFQVVPENGHVYANAQAYMADVCGRFCEKGFTVNHDIKIGPVADNIIDKAEELKADLVAMTTRGKSSSYPWTLGSTAQKIVTGGTTQLMLIKE